MTMNAEKDVTEWGRGFLVMIDHKNNLKDMKRATKDEAILRLEFSQFIKVGNHLNNLKPSAAGLMTVHEQHKQLLGLA